MNFKTHHFNFKSVLKTIKYFLIKLLTIYFTDSNFRWKYRDFFPQINEGVYTLILVKNKLNDLEWE